MKLKLCDRLVGWRVLATLLMMWAVLLGFDLIQTFVNEIDEIGQGDYSAGMHVLDTLQEPLSEPLSELKTNDQV